MKCCKKPFVCPVPQDIFSKILAGAEQVSLGSSAREHIYSGREVIFVCGQYRTSRLAKSTSGEVITFYK